VNETDFGGTLDHTLKASGLAAEHWKGMLEVKGIKSLEESLLNELREFFPGIEFEGRVEVVEDSYESFVLRYKAKGPHLSQYSESDRKCIFPVIGNYIANAITVCEETERKTPCAYPYPFEIKETVEVRNSIFFTSES